MDKTKLTRQLKKFEEHMMVDKGDVTDFCGALYLLRKLSKESDSRLEICESMAEFWLAVRKLDGACIRICFAMRSLPIYLI